MIKLAALNPQTFVIKFGGQDYKISVFFSFPHILKGGGGALLNNCVETVRRPLFQQGAVFINLRGTH